MNYCFLLEDEKSFRQILPRWLDYINFGCTEVSSYEYLETNNYIVTSGRGIYQLETKILFETIDTIQDKNYPVDKLVVVVDTEEIGRGNRRKRLMQLIDEHYPQKKFSFEIEIFECNVCLETWILGCQKLYPKQEEIPPYLLPYCSFYNVKEQDPENMTKPGDFDGSIAAYHFRYLHELTNRLARETGFTKYKYRKTKPGFALEAECLDGILDRINITSDLNSFKDFYNFISEECVNNI